MSVGEGMVREKEGRWFWNVQRKGEGLGNAGL